MSVCLWDLRLAFRAFFRDELEPQAQELNPDTLSLNFMAAYTAFYEKIPKP